MKLKPVSAKSLRRFFAPLCWLVCIILALASMPGANAASPRLSTPPKDAGPQSSGIADFPRIGLETLAINQLFDQDAASGAGFARIAMEWVNVEPDDVDPSEYSWAYYDWLYGQLAQRGLTPLVRIQKCPQWACNDATGPILDHSYTAFGQFMGAVAARYSQPPYNVHLYEFWNEPDGSGGPNNQVGWGMHPDKYVHMLQQAYTAVKAVDPQSVLVMGGLAYDQWYDEGGPFNPDFLPGVLDNGGAQYLDAAAFHYYSNNSHGWTNIGLKADSFRAVMSAHGAPNLPIISTEGGLTSAAEYNSSEQKQAQFLVQMLAQGSAHGLSGVTWFTDRDVANPAPGLEIHAKAGLLRTDNSIKPSYRAMQTFSEKIGSSAYLYTMGEADGAIGTLEGYRFRSKSGTKQVSVVWNNSDTPVTMTIPASHASDLGGATSMVGGSISTTLQPDGTRTLSVDRDPVYLEWNSLFSDVPAGSTFYPYVMCLVSNNVLAGYGDGTFRPSNNITRGQIAKVVSNAAGFAEPVTQQTFQDVPLGSTFYDFVGRLAARNYTSGYACGGASEPCVAPGNLPYFRPNANVTRGQVAKIVSEAAGYSDVPSGQQFEDVPVGSTFYTYAYRLVNRNIMSGYACGSASEPCNAPGNLPYFRPSSTATRGQASKIVGNAFFPSCQP